MTLRRRRPRRPTPPPPHLPNPSDPLEATDTESYWDNEEARAEIDRDRADYEAEMDRGSEFSRIDDVARFAAFIGVPISEARRILEQEEQDQVRYGNDHTHAGYDYERQEWVTP